MASSSASLSRAGGAASRERTGSSLRIICSSASTPSAVEDSASYTGAGSLARPQAESCAATCRNAPGDEVLLPAPWFFNHEMALALRGVRAVPLPCRAADGFLPDPERAAALVGARTRALVLVTPNNPTGAVMPPELVGRFAELCRERELWLLLDETYRDFLPEGQDAPHALFR